MCGAMPSMMFAHYYMKVPEFQHWQPERVILLVVMLECIFWLYVHLTVKV